MKKKHSFFLLEILISLFFISLMMISLFKFFTQTTLVKKNIDSAREEIFAQQNFEFRLSQIFSHLIFSDKQSFYTSEDSPEKKPFLSFIFQNTLDPIPFMNGNLRGTLLLDQNHHILLVLEPLEQKKEEKILPRQEILFSDVTSFSLFFFDPDPKQLCYVSEWKEKKSLPPMIKIVIKTRKKTIDFVFFPFLQNPMISYSDLCTS